MRAPFYPRLSINAANGEIFSFSTARLPIYHATIFLLQHNSKVIRKELMVSSVSLCRNRVKSPPTRRTKDRECFTHSYQILKGAEYEQ